MFIKAGLFVCLLIFAGATHGCSEGWEEFEGMCYHFSNDTQTYINAMDVCKMFGSRLVEIDSIKENAFIEKRSWDFQRVFWIGVNDLEVEGRWVFTESGTVPRFYNWGVGYPENNDDHSNCVMVNPIGFWTTIQCPATLAYVCEKTLDNGTSDVQL